MIKRLPYMAPLRKSSLCLFAVFMASGIAWGETATPLEATEQLPIKEVTIFKDGHTFVLHEGLMPVDAKECCDGLFACACAGNVLAV